MNATSFRVMITLGAAIVAASAQAQIRQPAQAETVPVEIALKIGAKNYEFAGQGECKAAPQASIYGIQAALYSASHSSGGQSLNLTLWQPKNGSPAMMTLNVATTSGRYTVDTVTGPGKQATNGSGNAVLQASGAGGVFTVTAVTASGEKVSGRIQCGRFAAIRTEGG